MPRIELIDTPLYTANDPYHWRYDNIPLQNLSKRQELINLSLDNVLDQLRDAVGTQGTISNRLNQSIDPDGSLQAKAIDDALHSMGSHTDDYTGTTATELAAYNLWVAGRSAPFVRMEKAESDKLANVASGATDVSLEIQRDDAGLDVVDITSGVARLEPSSSVTWDVTGNVVQAHLNFPVAAAHQHYYDQTPVHANTGSPDYINYKANTGGTAFVDGSLRVYINGIRLTTTNSVYVPGNLVTDLWTLLTFTTDATSGTFALSAAISSDDVIYIDYDINYI
jgi:hypothetical protein